MRLVVYALVLFGVLAAADTWSNITTRADRYAGSMARLGRFNGVVLVSEDGRVFRKAYGYADFARNIPNTVQTQFEIASLTKMFTAAAILKLRDRGALKLDDSVCRYVKPCPAIWQPVTIDELLHHRSGIPDYEDALEIESPQYYAFMTQPDSARRIVERQAKYPLDFAPGSKFSYSNTGYILLGFIIEAASHEPYARFLHDVLLDPAGMHSTGIIGVDTPRSLAIGYHVEIAWPQRLAGVSLADIQPSPVPRLALTPPSGDAALFSTVDDMYRWTQIMLGDGPNLFSPSERAEILTPVDGYGDGWMIGSAFGFSRYRHSGELPGYLSAVEAYPSRHTIVIMMDNLDTPTAAFTRDLQAIALEQPYDDPVSGTMITLSGAQQDALAGAYQLQSGAVLCVKRDPRFLLASIKGRFSAGLLPLSPTYFYMPLSSGTVTFTLSPDGRGKTVNMHYDGVDHRGSAMRDDARVCG